MSFNINEGARRLPGIRRAAFMVEDEEGRIMVYGFDPNREITVEMEHEYDQLYGVSTQAAHLETRLTISGISGGPFRHAGPFPAASAEEIEDTEQKLLSELNRKAIER